MGKLSCLPVFRGKPKPGRVDMKPDLSDSANDFLEVRDFSTQGRRLQEFKKNCEKEGSIGSCGIISTLPLSHYYLNDHLYAAFQSPREVAISLNQTDSQGEQSFRVSDQGGETVSGVSGQSGESLSGDLSQSAEIDADNEISNPSTACSVLDLYRTREYWQQSFLTSPDKCSFPLSDKESSIFLQFKASEDMIALCKDRVLIKVDRFGKECFAFDVEVNPLNARVEQWIQQSDLMGAYCHDESNNFNWDSDVEALESSYGAINHVLEHRFNGNAVRSLHASSRMAHLSGVNLHHTPSLRKFSCLRTINLSGNLIVQISARCLPRKLHSLHLSRNKISQINGLEELTGLRILDLSHNRLRRIGHGLSNCTHIKELYLGGNKIGEVEGLHKLPELLVLDLHSNKLASMRSISQLAANSASLMMLNLLGNPIFSNLGEDHVRKLIGALAPCLVYFNRRHVKMVWDRRGRLSDQDMKAAYRHFKKFKLWRKGVCSQLYGSKLFTYSDVVRKPSSVASNAARSKKHHHPRGHGHGYGHARHQQHHGGAVAVWEKDIMCAHSFQGGRKLLESKQIPRICDSRSKFWCILFCTFLGCLL